jgi:hypothetical protein
MADVLKHVKPIGTNQTPKLSFPSHWPGPSFGCLRPPAIGTFAKILRHQGWKMMKKTSKLRHFECPPGHWKKKWKKHLTKSLENWYTATAFEVSKSNPYRDFETVAPSENSPSETTTLRSLALPRSDRNLGSGTIFQKLFIWISPIVGDTPIPWDTPCYGHIEAILMQQLWLSDEPFDPSLSCQLPPFLGASVRTIWTWDLPTWRGRNGLEWSPWSLQSHMGHIRKLM